MAVNPRGRSDTRSRILAAAGRLFRHRGYAGTGIKAILTESAAPYGSLYHYFPGGKEQLGVAMLAQGGEMYRELVASCFDNDHDVVVCTREFFAGAVSLLEETDFEDACPIATIALEVANTSEALRVAAAAAFESWISVLDDRFRREGLDPESSRRLGVEMFCALEGAFVLARTIRSAVPVDTMGACMADAVARAVAGPGRTPVGSDPAAIGAERDEHRIDRK